MAKSISLKSCPAHMLDTICEEEYKSRVSYLTARGNLMGTGFASQLSFPHAGSANEHYSLNLFCESRGLWVEHTSARPC